MKSQSQDVELRSVGFKYAQWNKLKDFINNIPNGKSFTRKQLLENIYNNGCNYSYTTADTYRLLLCNTGFVKRIALGVFEKNHDIPDGMTVSKIRKYSERFTSDKWKEWFIPHEDRLREILKDFK